MHRVGEVSLVSGLVQLELVDRGPLQGKWRGFAGSLYRDLSNAVSHIAYTCTIAEENVPEQPGLVYVHRECLGGQLLGAVQCNCGLRMKWAHGQIRRGRKGIVIYLRDHAHGEGIRRCRGTGPYTPREAAVVIQILRQEGFNSVEMILARADLVGPLSLAGIEVKGQVQLVRPSNRQRSGGRRPKAQH